MTSNAAILRSTARGARPAPAARDTRLINGSHGALIWATPEIQAMCSGGFDLDVAFTAARLHAANCMQNGRCRHHRPRPMAHPPKPTSNSSRPHHPHRRIRHAPPHRPAHRPPNAPAVLLSLSASKARAVDLSIYTWAPAPAASFVEEGAALLSRQPGRGHPGPPRYSQRLDEVLQTLSTSSVRGSGATVRTTSPPSCSAWN